MLTYFAVPKQVAGEGVIVEPTEGTRRWKGSQLIERYPEVPRDGSFLLNGQRGLGVLQGLPMDPLHDNVSFTRVFEEGVDCWDSRRSVFGNVEHDPPLLEIDL